MDDTVSLKIIYEIIDLCKYARVDGEEMEVIVNSVLPNQREITIGIKDNLYDRYTFTFEDGDKFDRDFLPKLLDYFIKDDDVLSCTVTDPSIEGATVKSLMETKDGNDFLIESHKKDDFLKNYRDKINELNQNDLEEDKTVESEYTDLERMADITLKYISGRKKVKDYLVEIGEGKLKEEIDLIYEIYKENGNKPLSNEELKGKVKEKKNDKNTGVCNILISDLELPTPFLTDGIRNFIKNEEKYKKYKENDLFQKCKRVGIKLLNDGYFEYNLKFPRGADIIKLNDEELDRITTEKANSKYYILLKEKENYLKQNDLESAKIVDGFISHLKKTRTRRNLKNNLDINELKITETTNIKKNISINNLLETIDLYRDGKKDDEKLKVEIRDNDIYIGIVSGLSRDYDNFTVDKEKVKEVVEYLLLRDYTVKDENNNNLTITCKDNVEIVIPSIYKDTINKEQESNKEQNPASVVDNVGNEVENKNISSDEIIKSVEEKIKNLPNNIIRYLRTSTRYLRELMLLDNNVLPKEKIDEIIRDFERISLINPFVDVYEKLRKYKNDGKVSIDFYKGKLDEFKNNILKAKSSLVKQENPNDEIEPVQDVKKDNQKENTPSGIISELNKVKERKNSNFVSLNSGVGTDNYTLVETPEVTLGYEDIELDEKQDEKINAVQEKKETIESPSPFEETKEDSKSTIPNIRPREVDPEYRVEVVRGRVSDEKIDARLKEIEERRKNREFSMKILMEILKEDVKTLDKEKTKDALLQMKETLSQIEEMQKEDEIDKARSL